MVIFCSDTFLESDKPQISILKKIKYELHVITFKKKSEFTYRLYPKKY